MGRITAWVWATICGAVIVAVAMGIRQAFGIFLLPISTALEVGREQVGLVIAIQNLAFGLGLPLFGALADRRGPALILALGAVMYGLGLWLVTISGNLLMLFLSFGLLIGFAQSATTFVVVFGALGRFVPTERRGFAFGLVTAGASLGMFAFVPLAQILTNAFTWQGAFIGLALIALLIMVLAPGLNSKPNPQATAEAESELLGPVLARASRHSGYLLLNLGFFVCGFHVAFIGVHFPAYLADFGVAPVVAASALAMVGLANIGGSYFFGAMGDRFQKKYVLSALYFGRALVFALFLIVPVSGATAIAFGLVIGLLWLGTVPLTSGMVMQLFGARYLGTLYGIVFLSHQVGAFLGAWLGGAVYDRTGSYMLVWLAALGLSLLAGAIHWVIDDQPVRVARVQKQAA